MYKNTGDFATRIRQSQKDKFEVPKTAKLIEAKNIIAASRSRGGGGENEGLLNVHKVSFLLSAEVLELVWYCSLQIC